MGKAKLADGEAYAQSKLAITMWSRHLAQQLGNDGPTIIAVNPGSFLGSKMVKEAYGQAGKDLGIGANILARAATSDEFATATGQYFDNDRGSFASPHPDALDQDKNSRLVGSIESLIGSA
jgi:NAD(P)-dependent dehydrogenase (short-subunit alcohol dehydrogenase family)